LAVGLWGDSAWTEENVYNLRISVHVALNGRVSIAILKLALINALILKAYVLRTLMVKNIVSAKRVVEAQTAAW
jgi:hypothetical protein